MQWIVGDTSMLWGNGVLPEDWHYVPCPAEVPAFETCDFEIPLKKSGYIEVPNIDSDHFWLSGPEDVHATFQILSFHRSDCLSFEISSILEECAPRPPGIRPNIRYMREQNNTSVAAYKLEDEFRFLIKTPQSLIVVSDPSIGTYMGPTITPENIELLEKTVLNIRVKEK